MTASRQLLSEEWSSTRVGYRDALTLATDGDGLDLYVGRWEGDAVTLTRDVAEKLRDALTEWLTRG